MNYRIEKDTLGEVKVPADKYWGAQTERSRNNFKIGTPASMPIEIIRGFAYLKKAAAYANFDLGVLSAEKRDAIAQVCHAMQIPFVVVRAISDVADKESHLSFDEFLPLAAEKSSEMVLEMLNNLN